ncbi:MAG: hypothetical protein LKJ69_01835 [Lactobacillus sp.]|nr:hypothetical protein [Lactobacillus sp.]MCI2032123.1 hypothetical protein [Lactobacillus sp.]
MSAKPPVSPKTVVTSKQYTTQQRQKRDTTIVDTVVKPLNMASYSQPAKTIKAVATSGVTTIEKVRLQLMANNSQPEATKALIKQAQAAETLLKAMGGTDQAAYNADAKTFMTQTTTVAKAYFGGTCPQSLVRYRQRMAAKQSASSQADTSSTK